MWHEKYASRVMGLDSVEALFYPHATNDDEARRTLLLCERLDPRRTYLGLYRIERVALTSIVNVIGCTLYLQTGAPSKEQNRPIDHFFYAKDDAEARRAAATRPWKDSSLYRCLEIPI